MLLLVVKKCAQPLFWYELLELIEQILLCAGFYFLVIWNSEHLAEPSQLSHAYDVTALLAVDNKRLFS
jgi:hypothetical protein